MYIGTVNSYDPHTMTAEIISADGCQQYASAGIMMQSFDPNGGGSFSAPVPGATCLYDIVMSEVIIVGYYAPPNADGGISTTNENDDTGNQNNTDSISNTHINRNGAKLPTKSTFSGGSSTTTAGGIVTTIRDKMVGLSITPVFYIVMNALNEFLDIMATTFRFRSPAVDVKIDAGEKSGGSNPTQVNIVVRQSSAERADGAIPAINLVMGKDAGSGIINLRINNQDFLKVDLERNVVFDSKNVTFNSEDVVFNNNKTTFNFDDHFNLVGKHYNASTVTDSYNMP